MKTTVGFTAAFLLAALTTPLPVVYAQGTTLTADQQATVTSVTGTAYIVSADGTKTPATVGAVLKPGDTIVTDANSTVGVKLAGSKSSLTVNANSQLALSTETANGAAGTKYTFTLKTGSVGGNVAFSDPDSSLVINTDSGSTTIKTASFTLNETGNVTLASGSVETTTFGPNGPTTVSYTADPLGTPRVDIVSQ